MKQLRLLFTTIVMLLLLGNHNMIVAQTVSTIGTGVLVSGTNDNSGPIYRSSATSSFNFSRHVMLYTAVDLAAVGIYPGATISKVAWFKTSAFTLASGRTATMNILMQNSSATALTTGTWDSKTSTMTNVYTNAAITDANIPATSGWVEFVLTTPFVYTGGALEVATDWAIAPGSGGASTGTFQWQYTTAASIQSIGTSSGSALSGTTNLASSFSRNMNIQLTHTGGTPPSCPAPTSLTVSNVTATSATFAWTENGTATNWVGEFGPTGFTLGTGTSSAATQNPLTLANFSPATSYDFYVRSVCSAGDSSSWAGPVTFTTSCVTFTAPFTENFDGLPLTSPYTDLPNCWTPQTGPDFWDVTNDIINTGHTWLPDIGDHTTGTSNYMWIDASSNITANEMVTPNIDISGLTTPYAGFWFASNNITNTINHTIALDAWDGTAWVNLTSLSGNFPGWVEVGAVVPSTIPTTTKFRIYAIANPNGTTSDYFYNDLGVDDFFVVEAPSCPAPTSLAASNITVNSGDVSWVAGGAETAWEVEYGVSGFTQGTGTTAAVTTTLYSITGLTFETNYDVYVRGICAPGDTSVWVGPLSFFTGYCTPAPSSVDGNGITNVTMGGVNNTTGIETGNYGNYSAQVATAAQGGTLFIDITYETGYTYDTWAWVDWNNDLDFTDPGEEFFLGTSSSTNPTVFSSSISIPATALGNYRIRIGGADTGLGTTSPSNPCYTGSWGSFEDYTLNVIVPLNPFALLTPANNTIVAVAGPAQNPIDISWESAGSGATMYEWRANATGGSLNTPLVTIPADNMGMDTTLSLTVQAVDDLLASLGVNIGDTAVLDWTVVAYNSTGDSLFATTPYTVSLVRFGISSPLLLKAPQNNGSTTTLRAPNGSTSHTFMRAATVVLPTEFSTAGIAANTIIRNFGFNVNGTIPAGSVTGIFKLYLQNTTDVTYNKGTAWTGILPGMIEVFNDTITINGGGNAWDVVLDTLFAYGGNSVYVAYDWQLVANPLGSSISYLANTSLPSGLVSASSTSAPPATLSGSSFRPEFSWGIDRDADDLEIVALYAMGKNPLNYSQPEQIQAIVRNNGYLPADKTITLDITGTNPYTTSENISLAPGQETVISFMAFNPTTAGFNTITASVPADQVNSNNTQTWVQETTTNTFSYADSVLTGLGGVGYNTGSGLLLNRYYVNGTASVNQVNVRISDNLATVGNTVYAVLVDTSGTIVAQSANYVVTVGDLNAWKTFDLISPVNVSDVDVYVGLAQTANATGYFPVAFQGESPTRPNAYFSAGLTGGALSPVNGFRLMVEAVVGPACAITSTVAVTNADCFGAPSGTITITPAGGTAPYTYLWSDGQTTATATGLTAAVYTVTVTDANGCSLTETGTVGQPAPIVLTATAVADTSGAGIGAAVVTATGGTAPYTYLWSDGQTTATATGLVEGDYTVTVTDANGCTEIETVTVINGVGTVNIAVVSALSVYPNPTSGTSTLNLELSRNAEVAISIYTVTGALVQDFGKENTSRQTLEIDLSSYPEGMYFIRLVIDNQVVTKRILLAK